MPGLVSTAGRTCRPPIQRGFGAQAWTATRRKVRRRRPEDVAMNGDRRPNAASLRPSGDRIGKNALRMMIRASVRRLPMRKTCLVRRWSRGYWQPPHGLETSRPEITLRPSGDHWGPNWKLGSLSRSGSAHSHRKPNAGVARSGSPPCEDINANIEAKPRPYFDGEGVG